MKIIKLAAGMLAAALILGGFMAIRSSIPAAQG